MTTRNTWPKRRIPRQRVVVKPEVPLEQTKLFQMSSPRGQALMMRREIEGRSKKR
jgi:hypothetical protein